MTYDELPELHYITPIENLSSILEHGILSHRRVARAGVMHVSVAKEVVQDRRSKIKVPGGRSLHEYVNLYFHARNPMLYLRRGQHRDLCVLSVRKEVFDLDGVVVTDQNASSDYVRFAAGREGLRIIDAEQVYAKDWTHRNPVKQMRHKSVKCAEVLVPDQVDTTFIRGVYVSCEESEDAVSAIRPELQVKISSDLFFQ